jgi:hypothetical protein
MMYWWPPGGHKQALSSKVETGKAELRDHSFSAKLHSLYTAFSVMNESAHIGYTISGCATGRQMGLNRYIFNIVVGVTLALRQGYHDSMPPRQDMNISLKSPCFISLNHIQIHRYMYHKSSL